MRGMNAFGTPPVAQNFADGGIVKRLKGMLGIDEERNAKLAEYRRNAAAEKATQAPQPADATQPAAQAITRYAGGDALKRREKEAGLNNYRDGGPVRGPGTGTSDDVRDEVPEGTFIMPADSTQVIGEQALAGMGADKVPVNLSNGEFKIPPEQVHAVGAQVLRDMKDATHTPVAPQARGMSPELFFADGDLVQDEEKRRQNSPANIFPGSHPDAGANVYAGAGSANGLGSSGQFANVPQGIGQQPGRTAAPAALQAPALAQRTQAERQELIGQIPGASRPAPAPSAMAGNAPVTSAAAPPITLAPSTPSALSQAGPSQLYMQDRTQEMKDQWGAGNYAGAVGTGARTAAQGLGMYGIEAVDKTLSPWVDAGRRMVGGLLGTDTPQGELATAAPPATASPGALSGKAPPPNPVDQRLAAGVQTTPGGELPDPQSVGQVMPGVYQHGRGQYSDKASGMGMSAFAGQPSAQNIRAADALAGSQQAESMGRVRAQIAAEQEAQRNSPQAMRQRGMDILNNRGSRRTAGMLMEAAAGMDRESTTRSSNALDSQRYASADRIALARYGLDVRGQAPKLREAERMDALYTRYESASPDERKAIAQQIRELSGKTESAKDNVITLGGGQEWDAAAGTMRNVPQRAIDLRTNQEIGGSPKPQLPPGMKRQIGTANGKPVYEDVNGKTVVAKG